MSYLRNSDDSKAIRIPWFLLRLCQPTFHTEIRSPSGINSCTQCESGVKVHPSHWDMQLNSAPFPETTVVAALYRPGRQHSPDQLTGRLWLCVSPVRVSWSDSSRVLFCLAGPRFVITIL